MAFCSSGRAAGAVPVTLRVALSLDNYVGGEECVEMAILFDHGAMRIRQLSECLIKRSIKVARA